MERRVKKIYEINAPSDEYAGNKTLLRMRYDKNRRGISLFSVNQSQINPLVCYYSSE